MSHDSSEVPLPDPHQQKADKERLITKGQSVLQLCIQQNKLLCVQGFVDSQIERGGVYLEVVQAMRNYIASELKNVNDKRERIILQQLHDYVDGRLSLQAEKIEEIVSL